MKKIISGLVTMAAVVASTSASSFPGNGAQVVNFKTYNYNPYGAFCDDSNICNFFSAWSYDDNSGPQAGVSVETYDLNLSQTVASISCSGLSFANAVSVNQGNGNTSIDATLDPSDTNNCQSYNVSASVTVNLVGQFDDVYHYSISGKSNSTYYGSNVKSNSKYDHWSEIFTGTTGLYTGSINGYADVWLSTDSQRVK
ncbi:MAG: hypothetical protein ACXW04_07695 [Methylobacter sp.]